MDEVDELFLKQYRQINTERLRSMFKTNQKQNIWIMVVLKERGIDILDEK